MIDLFAGLLMAIFFYALVIAVRKYGMWAICVGVLLLVAACNMRAQDCNAIIDDGAGVLGNKVYQVGRGAQELINQGADVHIVTVQNANGNMDTFIGNRQNQCRTWQSSNGGRKSTLLVLAVSIKDHKVGAYYGSAFDKALNDHWNRIKQDYMVPRLRDGDFAGAFVAAEEQFTKRLAAAKDEALHPAQTNVINQSTDYSNVWLWLIASIVLFVFVYALLVYLRYRREVKTERERAQQTAISYRNRALADLRKLEDEVKDKEAAGETIPPRAQLLLDQASQEYQRLGDSSHTDPEDDSLDTSIYNIITRQYDDVSTTIDKARSALRMVSVSYNETAEKSKPSTEAAPSTPSAASQPSATSTPSQPSTMVASSEHRTEIHHHHDTTYVPVPSYVPPVVVVERESTGYVTPVESEPQPVHHHHSSYTSSDSDSGGGGGSSSWGSDSSSSSSSSSYDSGGSSSWSSDSGSSFDSGGGGGSSDY